MKLAISNIAWPSEASAEMLPLVRAAGCSGLEIAPTRLWPEPLRSTGAQRREFRRRLEDCGLRAAALHSLLWGRDDLGLFREPAAERSSRDFLCGLAGLAADLGAGIMVFGSPQGRRRGAVPLEEAFSRAAEFFAEPARVAAAAGVCIVIEPLGPGESDFINTLDEGRRLVELVASPGFGLHIDAKSLAEEGPGALGALAAAAGQARHFHINAPGLDEVGTATYHQDFGRTLREAGYAGFASIEMKTLPDHRGAVERSIAAARRHYLGIPAEAPR